MFLTGLDDQPEEFQGINHFNYLKKAGSDLSADLFNFY